MSFNFGVTGDADGNDVTSLLAVLLNIFDVDELYRGDFYPAHGFYATRTL